jgi:hypothetical protein
MKKANPSKIGDAKELVGMVEIVEQQQKQPFRSYEELWEITASDHEGAKRQSNKNKKIKRMVERRGKRFSG